MNDNNLFKKKYLIILSIALVTISIYFKENNQTKKHVKISPITNKIEKEISKQVPTIVEDKHPEDITKKKEHDHSKVERRIKKIRKQTKREKEFTQTLLKRNPHLKNITIEITHDLKNKVIAIIQKDEISYTAEIDKATGEIIKTWGRTQFEYRKDLEKLNFKLPEHNNK